MSKQLEHYLVFDENNLVVGPDDDPDAYSAAWLAETSDFDEVVHTLAWAHERGEPPAAGLEGFAFCALFWDAPVRRRCLVTAPVGRSPERVYYTQPGRAPGGEPCRVLTTFRTGAWVGLARARAGEIMRRREAAAAAAAAARPDWRRRFTPLPE